MSKKVRVDQIIEAVLEFREPFFRGDTIGPIDFQLLDANDVALSLDDTRWIFGMALKGDAVAAITKDTILDSFPVTSETKTATLTVPASDTVDLVPGIYILQVEVEIGGTIRLPYATGELRVLETLTQDEVS